MPNTRIVLSTLLAGVEVQGDSLMRLYLNSVAYSSFGEPRGFDSVTKKGHVNTTRPLVISTVVSLIGTPIWSTIKRFLSNELSMLANEV